VVCEPAVAPELARCTTTAHLGAKVFREVLTLVCTELALAFRGAGALTTPTSALGWLDHCRVAVALHLIRDLVLEPGLGRHGGRCHVPGQESFLVIFFEEEGGKQGMSRS